MKYPSVYFIINKEFKILKEKYSNARTRKGNTFKTAPHKCRRNHSRNKHLGVDSLDVVEMLMSIEEETGVVVPDDAIMNLKTVGDVAKYIEDNK